MKFATAFEQGMLLLLAPTIMAAQTGLAAQRFGEVPVETFAPSVYSLDSSANAIVLFDKGKVSFDAGYFTNRRIVVVLEKHTRIRILHKNALALASLVLSTYRKTGETPVIDDFKGATYNLEDGQVVVTKLDKTNIFKEHGDDFNLEKVAFPNVKEGSVIEYSFRIVYPGYFYLPSWNFQGDYPELWSEYDISVPTLFDYAIMIQGHQPFAQDTSFLSSGNLPVALPSSPSGPVVDGIWHGQIVERIWAMKNVPALEKREPYTTTLKNHISKVDFQLSAIRNSGYEQTFRSNWNQLRDELMKSEHFGLPLSERNHWMKEELKNLAGEDKISMLSAQKIYAYVRDHFESNNVENIYLSQPLKKIWDDRKGTVADINLLLTALFLHQGFEAAPVILSTRGHGVATEAYPLLKDYNYVIVRVKVDGQYQLLDASKSYIGFGQLPEICYNGSGRVIDSDHDLIPLSADLLKEKRKTIVMLGNDDSGGYSGTFTHIAGVFESMELRNRMKRIKPADFFESLRKTMVDTKTMEDYGFDSLNVPGQALSWHYTMKYNFSQERIYFNPIMHERMTNNPFNSPERHYPVEMPYCEDYSYVLNMDIPRGYAVEEMPKSQRITLEDSSASFEYRIDSTGGSIQFYYLLRIKRAYFPVESYRGLRDFFSLIVNKEKEQIIFKKIDQP